MNSSVFPCGYHADSTMLNAGRTEIAFVLDNLTDWEKLAQSIPPGVELVIVDSRGDGLAQISDYLAQKEAGSVDAVHLFSHGQDSQINLGETVLNGDKLLETETLSRLATLREAMSSDGDLLLYGCNVAQGAAGQSFISRLSELTGADVAASEDATGSASLGGDWILEGLVGEVGTAALADESYDGLLLATLNGNAFEYWMREVDDSESKIFEGTVGSDIEIDWSPEPGETIDISHTDGRISVKFPTNYGYTVPAVWLKFPGVTFTGFSIAPTTTNPYKDKLTPSFSGDTLTITVDPSYANITDEGSGFGFVYFDFTLAGADSAPPSFDVSPVASLLTSSSLTLSASLDEAGTLYYVALADGAAAPSVAQIMAGLDSTGAAAIKSGSSAAGSAPHTASFPVTGLTAGTSYDFYVVAKDTANNQMLLATRVDVTTLPAAPGVPDLQAASDSGSSSTDNITSHTTPTFNVPNTLNGATVTLFDDADSNGIVDTGESLGTTTGNGGTVSIVSSALSAGAHNIKAIQSNGAGSSAASAALPVTIDTSAPAVPSTPDMNAGTDSGSSNTDNLTNDNTPTFEGTAEAGSTVTLYDTDGTTLLGSGTADGSGNWSITVSALTQGTHSITARATDAAGNTSPASSGLSVTVDTTPPGSLALSASSIASSATGVNATVGTLSAIDTQDITYALATGDGTNDAHNGSFNISGNSLRTSSALAGGSYQIYLKATDAAGNISYLAQTITVATGPTVTDAFISITSTPTGTSSTYKIGDTVTAQWDNSAGGQNQTGVTGVTMDFSAFGGGTAVTATNNGSGIWSASHLLSSGSIDAGNRNVSVSATNSNGTTTTTDTSNLTVDNQAPTVGDARIAISGASGTGGAYKIGDTVTVTWNNTAGGDNNTDIASVTADFSAFGGGSAVVATNNSGTWSATYTIVAGNIDATNRNVSLTVTDDAGNVTSRADTSNATVDTQAPTVTAAHVSLSGATGTGGVFKVGDTVTATWNNSASGDNNTDTISGVTMNFSQFGGGAAVAATHSGGIWTATYTIVAGSIDNQSNRNVSVTATDNAGNTTTVAGTDNVTVDNQPPSAPGAPDLAAASDSGGSTTDNLTHDTTPTLTGSGAVANGTVTIISSLGGTLGTATADGSGHWSFTPGTPLAAGTHSITATSTDAAGNVSTASPGLSLTIDTTAPTTTVTINSITTDSGTAGDFITNDSDGLTLNASLGTALAPGETLEYSTDGSTWADITGSVSGTSVSHTASSLTSTATVRMRVSDGAGNSGPVASQSITIDTTAPAFVPATSTPTDDATNIGISSDIIVRFDEALAAGSDLGKVYLKDVTTDTLVPATITLNADGHLVINPTGDLAYSTAYYLTWEANALKDAAGNSVAALGDETGFNFNTAAAPSGGGGGGGGGVSPLPDDGDDIPAVVENGVPGLASGNGEVVAGDGNGDGVADSQQASVTSLSFLNTETVSNPGDAPPVFVTLVSDSLGGLPDTQDGNGATITHIRQLDAPDVMPAGVEMPLGRIEFSAEVGAAGTTENFSLLVDAAVGINSYWKQSRVTGEWVDIASQVAYVGDKVRIDFSIADGGEFDADGKADGIITDPGALGISGRPAPSLAEAVTGLYIAYYNRAPDAEGLAYWVNQMESGGVSFEEISAGFAAHVRFEQEYGGMDDPAFVAALYRNVLGNVADAGGQAYWESRLETVSRSELVAEFVLGALSADLSAALGGGNLSAADYEIAYQRQAMIDNQVEAGLAFVGLGAVTRPQSAPEQLDSDSAYLAAIKVLEPVTTDYITVSQQKITLAGLQGNPGAMDILLGG